MTTKNLKYWISRNIDCNTGWPFNQNQYSLLYYTTTIAKKIHKEIEAVHIATYNYNSRLIKSTAKCCNWYHVRYRLTIHITHHTDTDNQIHAILSQQYRKQINLLNLTFKKILKQLI